MQALRKNVINKFATLALSFAAISISAQEMKTATSIIDPDAGILTMVNVLTPEPGKQAETIKLLQAGMENTIRYQPGFISANIHQSLNSEQVVVYAQWQDQASVDETVKLIQSGKAPNMLQAFTIAHADFHPYRVVSVHLAASKKTD